MPAEWAAQNRVDCGWLTLAESRGKPDSRRLKLWVAIARAESPDKSEPPLLYIHGGPGYATVDYVFPYFPKGKTWPAFRKTRDLVFLDQRGTGRSGPAFCKELGATLEQVAKDAPPAREALDRSKAAFAACRPQMLAQGFDFAAYGSTATVEDAEDLRRALGIAQWNLYGISYGSLVGLEYLRRHPGSVRAAIFDSLFPPNSPRGAEQVTTTALAYQALQRACSSDAACGKRFPDILGSLQQAVERLNATPLSRPSGGRITGDGLRGIAWSLLVRTKTAPWVPLALERAAASDEAVIRKLDAMYGGSGGFGDYSHGQSLAVNCYEMFGGTTADSTRAAMQRYPYLAARDAVAGEVDELCAAWQPQRAPPEFHAPVRSDVPVLLYGGEFDRPRPTTTRCWPRRPCRTARWCTSRAHRMPRSHWTIARAASPMHSWRRQRSGPISAACSGGRRRNFRPKDCWSSWRRSEVAAPAVLQRGAALSVVAGVTCVDAGHSVTTSSTPVMFMPTPRDAPGNRRRIARSASVRCG